MGQVALFSVIKWTCFQLTKTDLSRYKVAAEYP